jgi:hypothetical protein
MGCSRSEPEERGIWHANRAYVRQPRGATRACSCQTSRCFPRRCIGCTSCYPCGVSAWGPTRWSSWHCFCASWAGFRPFGDNRLDGGCQQLRVQAASLAPPQSLCPQPPVAFINQRWDAAPALRALGASSHLLATNAGKNGCGGRLRGQCRTPRARYAACGTRVMPCGLLGWRRCVLCAGGVARWWRPRACTTCPADLLCPGLTAVGLLRCGPA